MVHGGTGRWICEAPFFKDAGCGHYSLRDITAASDPICVRDDHPAYHWEDAYRIAELTYRKEVDSATRLYNKNKYEDMLANYYTMVERVAVVLWDINNLKEINDRMGHGMGDKLIETMSGAIYAQTDSRKKAYRIGGDEFVMLIENPEKQEAEQIIQNVRDKLARHREEGGLRVSSATGTAEGNGIDILKIVHDADERKYEDKKRGKESREYAMFYSE